MLNLIVFVCGAALMSLELVAARVLAPFLGNSIYVWGSVIAIVMFALSLGYWLGGHAADRYGPRRVLPVVIGAAGLTIIVVPLIAQPVLPWVAEFGPRVGALLAATIVFFAPSLLLATVSPLGVRLAASRGIEHVGRSAGSLYAISTAGSIVGTLATSFWLIPLLSLEPLITWTGVAVCATSLLSFTLVAFGPAEESPSRREQPFLVRYAAQTTLALVAVGLIVGSYVLLKVAPADDHNAFGETVLFQADTQYHRVTVTEDASTRHLRFDRSHQTAIDLEDGYTSRILYPDYMHLALAVKPDARRVLVLGLGGGAISKRYWRDYPEVTVDSVEIDPVVVDVAERYFGLPSDERLRTYTNDARRFVQNSEDTYDIVLIDAYYADALPFHLTTQQFFQEVERRMSRDGVIAYNVISAVEGDKSELFRSMYRTAGGVFEHLWVFPIGLGEDGDAEKMRNIIVMATNTDVAEGTLRERVEGRVNGRVSIEGYSEFAEDLYTEVVPVGDVPLLTDGYAPTDSLIELY